MRIWFNHWFSTAYHLIELMREDISEDLSIVGTSKSLNSVFLLNTDEKYIEPVVDAEKYIEFCIDFCKEKAIDVFVPRTHLTDIVNCQERFDDAGVKLFANRNKKLMQIVDDKIKTYDYFRDNQIDCIPKVRTAHSVDEFIKFYDELKTDDIRLCYKLVVDEGARSFRVIDDRVETSRGLYEAPGMKVSYKTAIKILESYDFSIPMLIMPYLSGVEISADCLKTKTGNIIIPRYKIGGRYSEIRFDKNVMDECEKIMGLLDFDMPMNIQFRMQGESLKLLEINPRMSGGLMYSVKASGINIPSIALRQLFGEEPYWKYPYFDRKTVSFIEEPLCIN